MSDKASILIVDDIPENIQVVAHILKSTRYEMSFATSGEDALHAVAASRFDLILLDIMMPTMDGFEVCTRLKQDPATQAIPVIFLTARSDHDSLIRAFDVGGIDYITKPFNAAELLVRVDTHLSLRRTQRELSERNLSLQRQVEQTQAAQSALKRAHEELQLFLDNIHDLALHRRLDGQPMLCNSRFLELTGVEPTQLGAVGSWLALIHPDDQSCLRSVFSEYPQGRASAEVSYRLRDRQGQWRWIESRLVGVPDEAGGWRGYHDIGRDVTEQRLAVERDLNRAYGRLDAIVDALPDQLFVLDEQERVVDYRVPQSELQYTDPHRYLNHTVAELIPTEAYARVQVALAQARQSGRSSGATYSLDFDGQTRWFELSVSNGGRRVDNQLIVLVRDISERVDNLDRLRQAASVFNNVAEAILITDAQQQIIAVNHAFTRMTGWEEEELRGMTPSVLKSGAHDAPYYDELWKSLNETGHWRGEFWNRRKGGEGFPVVESINSVLDDEGEVRFYIGVFSDVTEQRQSQEQIRHLSDWDLLTGLPNRKLLFDRLHQAISRARRNSEGLALLQLDLDRFKHINDSMGHPVGDQLLTQVARRLEHITRDNDTLARVSGDEFILLVEDIDNAYQVANIAEKLQEAFTPAYALDDLSLYLSCSIGISLYPEDGQDGDTLLRSAEAAMYAAKEHGGGNYRFFTNEMSTRAYQRILLESHLRRALVADELEIYFQPQISLPDQAVIGAEVLVRWQHPELGLIMPDQFIPLAEESGLILELGLQVLRKACRQLQAWREAGVELVDYLAVNVSALQVMRSPLVEQVLDVLHETGLPAQSLELEITENAIMQNPDRAVEIFGDLRKMGVRLALDDFGTGYSSLGYLKRLPIDKLKIDKSFVLDLLTDKNDRVITHTVVNLAKSLGIKVIAEGVEEQAQADFLLTEGCDEGQGYLYSRPLPREAFEQWVESRRHSLIAV